MMLLFTCTLFLGFTQKDNLKQLVVYNLLIKDLLLYWFAKFVQIGVPVLSLILKKTSAIDWTIMCLFNVLACNIYIDAK